MIVCNCYICRLPVFHISRGASSEGPAEPAWFDSPIHGHIGSDEVDEPLECPDWQPKPDLYDQLAENTSPEHARLRQPEMVRAGVTSQGIMLTL